MAYAIELVETRTYSHYFLVDTDDEIEARNTAEQLAMSSNFLCDIVGNGSYLDTNLEVGDVWETKNECIALLTSKEIAEYTEE